MIIRNGKWKPKNELWKKKNVFVFLYLYLVRLIVPKKPSSEIKKTTPVNPGKTTARRNQPEAEVNRKRSQNKRETKGTGWSIRVDA